MRNPLLKRLPRELRRDKAKYTVLALFLILMIGLVAGYMVADGSMVKAYDESFEKYRIENGHFILDEPAGASVLDKVRREHVSLQEQFYKDKVSKAGSTKGDDFRVYKPRRDMNLLAVMEGRMPEQDDEIIVDRLYAENNDLQIGDSVDVGGRAYTLTGTAAFSDYSCLFRTTTDFMFDANDFTVAVVTEDAWKDMGKAGLKCCYAWRNKDQSLSEQAQKDKAGDIGDVLAGQRNVEVKEVLARPDNQAITFAGDDMGGDMVMMETLLYIVLVIIAFVFAISTRSTIEQEARVIGTLRASGYTRRELLAHFITLPMLMVVIASVIGNIIGYTAMKKYVVMAYYHSYGLPPYETVFSWKALLSTTLIPALIILAVELFVIGRALRHGPLQFLRGELGSTGARGSMALPVGWPFPMRFRARIILQNKSAYITMFLGIFLASVLLFFGTMFMPLLDHFQEEVVQSKFANYQYILKEPAYIHYDDGEKYAVKTVKNDNGEDITVYGILHNSAYFDGDLQEKSVLVSSAYAEKYGVKPEDKLELKERFGPHKYELTVGGICDYPASLCVFMYINEFNEVFRHPKGYFCGYFSDKPIRKLKEKQISSVITEKEMTVVSKQLEDSVGAIFPLFGAFAVILYILLIFLLAKIAIDRNAYAISMVKILGYTDREIARLYSRATGIVVVFSVLVCMGLSSLVVKKIYFLMMLSYNGWLSYYTDPRCYGIMLGVGLGCYFLVSRILMRRIRRIPMGEALKGVE